MTISAPPVLVGEQQPRIRSVPPARSSAGDEAIELAHRAGLHLDPWQQLVLRDALGETAFGRWAAFEVGLIVPRQNGKGSVLEALELAALFLADPSEPPPLVLHSAHEFKTSAEHFRRVRDLVEGTPFLRRQVRIVRTAAGAESVELESGARLRFVTRTGGSGRGFSADLVVIDEAFNLTAEAMAAVLPTMSARPNPQIWYTSSAGMLSSEQLARVRDRGMRGGDPSLAFFEWSAEDGADLDDRAAWAQANPSLGLRIPESFVVTERAALPDQQFGRERLGLWPRREDDAPGLDTAAWGRLADPSAERGRGQVFGVATSPDRSWSAVAVAWRRPDGSAQVMLARYAAGDEWVAESVRQMRGRWSGRVLASASARGLVGDAVNVPAADQAAADNALATAIAAGTVRHGNQPALNIAVKEARWRPTPSSRVLDQKGTADISPVVAASLAVHGLNTAPAEGGWMVSFS